MFCREREEWRGPILDGLDNIRDDMDRVGDGRQRRIEVRGT